MTYFLALDQGTTSSRAIIYSSDYQQCALSQQEFQQHFPQPGFVEHEPEDIWQSTLTCAKNAITQANIDATQIAGIGLSNQRETTIMWDKKTGEIVYRAIVWQDRRSQPICQALRERGLEPDISARTGLLCDPYFSASKIHWLLENIAGVRELAEKNRLAFGTVDTFLIWKLTGGQRHVTDVTNASRTLLFNINTLAWDESLCDQFQIPLSVLPEVLSNVDDFGRTEKSLFGTEIEIVAVAGDQQAALIGQQCFAAGMNKCTYGTGAFLLQNTGVTIAQSKNRLLTTVAYRIQEQTHYAIEGSLFMAGAIVQWLRDKMEFIREASDSEALATSVSDSQGVYLIPAFVGLGAPFWCADARAAVLGMTRDTSKAHITRAALEAVAYETKALVDAMQADTGQMVQTVRVDGGMVANRWLMQFLANVMQCEVVVNRVQETSALGVALLAGLAKGRFDSLAAMQTCYARENVYRLEDEKKNLVANHYQDWCSALARIIT